MSFRVRRIREFLARALRPTRKKVVIAVLAVVVLGALIFWSVRIRGFPQSGRDCSCSDILRGHRRIFRLLSGQ